MGGGERWGREDTEMGGGGVAKMCGGHNVKSCLCVEIKFIMYQHLEVESTVTEV